jgi:hypothetical protein
VIKKMLGVLNNPQDEQDHESLRDQIFELVASFNLMKEEDKKCFEPKPTEAKTQKQRQSKTQR